MGSDDRPSPQSEDYLLERKTKNDLKDLLKTMVAFANTVRPGHVAKILIGERNDGTPEGLTTDEADNIQKRVRGTAEQIYPPIVWRSSGYLNGDKQCLRVEIEPSGDTPHFGGAAWLRRGSETVKASDAEFQRLIDMRSSIVRELDQWIGKPVTFEIRTQYNNGFLRSNTHDATLKLVNQFYATLGYSGNPRSYPLKSLTLSWDDGNSRLKLILETRPTNA
jgi:Putative DNA-binding domain